MKSRAASLIGAGGSVLAPRPFGVSETTKLERPPLASGVVAGRMPERSPPDQDADNVGLDRGGPTKRRADDRRPGGERRRGVTAAYFGQRAD